MTNDVRTTLIHTVGAVGLLLGAAAAQAGGSFDGWQRSSQVTDLVTMTGPGEWTYEFTVVNTSVTCVGGGAEPCEDTGGLDPVIVDWELPYFTDMGIGNITSPDGWSWAIETIGVANGATGWDGQVAWWNPSDPWYAVFGPDSPFGQNNLTQVLHWYVMDASGCNFFPDLAASAAVVGPPCPGIVPVESVIPGHNNSLSGFSFTAAYDPAAAPYQASWLDVPPQSGDPAFPFGALPGSPSVTGVNGLPVSPAWLLIGAGGLLMARMIARRRR